jgi:hypothetical protein
VSRHTHTGCGAARQGFGQCFERGGWASSRRAAPEPGGDTACRRSPARGRGASSSGGRYCLPACVRGLPAPERASRIAIPGITPRESRSAPLHMDTAERQPPARRCIPAHPSVVSSVTPGTHPPSPHRPAHPSSPIRTARPSYRRRLPYRRRLLAAPLRLSRSSPACDLSSEFPFIHQPLRLSSTSSGRDQPKRLERCRTALFTNGRKRTRFLASSRTTRSSVFARPSAHHRPNESASHGERRPSTVDPRGPRGVGRTSSPEVFVFGTGIPSIGQRIPPGSAGDSRKYPP